MKKINSNYQTQAQQSTKELGTIGISTLLTEKIRYAARRYSKIFRMTTGKNILAYVFFLFFSTHHVFVQAATPTNVIQPAVWANEAIIATYTLDHDHFIEQEKALAKYFTSTGWIDYSQAMQTSNLPQQIKTNAYVVTAVATLPPTLKSMPNGGWEATMPILVLYKNPAYSQKQDLNIVLKFVESTTQGVRGFAIQSLKSTVITPPCQCAKRNQGATIV